MKSQGIMPQISQGVYGVPSETLSILRPKRIASPMMSNDNAGCMNPQATPMNEERYLFLKSHQTIPGIRPLSFQKAFMKMLKEVITGILWSVFIFRDNVCSLN
jgi:hypothetical protein